MAYEGCTILAYPVGSPNGSFGGVVAGHEESAIIRQRVWTELREGEIPHYKNAAAPEVDQVRK